MYLGYSTGHPFFDLPVLGEEWWNIKLDQNAGNCPTPTTTSPATSPATSPTKATETETGTAT
jgi:hypothetical protein